MTVEHWLRQMHVGDSFAVCRDEIVVRTPQALADAQQFRLLDIENGEEKRCLPAPSGALMHAVTRNGGVLLCRTSVSGEVTAVDIASGRPLWSGGPYGFYGVGTDDSFILTSQNGLSITRVEAGSGRVLWTRVPPRRQPEAGIASWRPGSITVLPESVVLHLETGGLLRLSLETGEIIASGSLRWIGRAIVTPEHVVAGGAEGLSIIDHATMVEIERLEWGDEIREALHGQIPETCGFYASQRAVVWTTGSGAVMGVHRPGARGGKRKVWVDRIPNAMFGTLHPIVCAGEHLYLDPLRRPGSDAAPPGICCYVSDEL